MWKVMVVEEEERTQDGLLRSVLSGNRKQVMAACGRLEEQLLERDGSELENLLITAGIYEQLIETARRRLELDGCGEDRIQEILDEKRITETFFRNISTETAPMILSELRRYCMELCDRFAMTGKKQKNHIPSIHAAKGIDRVIACMHRDYRNPNLHMSDVAQQAYVSNSYLTLQLKEQTGKTFSEYLTEIRMEHARDLLLSTDRKTYEVAEACGFLNATYFSTVFKRLYGVTPTVYRQTSGKSENVGKE